jgi:hypothetical protein
MEPFVKLHLEVESMRYHLVKALNARELELRELIDEEIDRAFAEINLRDLIQSEFRKILPEAISSVLRSQTQAALWSEDPSGSLRTMVERSIANFFQELLTKNPLAS